MSDAAGDLVQSLRYYGPKQLSVDMVPQVSVQPVPSILSAPGAIPIKPFILLRVLQCC